MLKLVFVNIFLFGFLLCNAQQRIIFINSEDNMLIEKINFYKYPKEVSCEFTNGTKKRLILEKLVGDSLIFRKYYNQEIFDCIKDSVKNLHIYEKKSIDQVLTLPRKVKCIFKDGSKQNLVLEKIIEDSLIFKKVAGINKNFNYNINAIEIIKVNKKDFGLFYKIGIFSALSVYMSYQTDQIMSQISKGVGQGFPPYIIFIAMSPLTIGSAIISLVSIANIRKNYPLKDWRIYVL